ncbi:D-alanyl-D-alanine carboxypeptidase family protein [Sporosarcina pasteurii]|uniref:D-alanyl-D-alanine carboxypeptidase n=1 Tax=Sporosarcina pasteurii TaxID=1474 RepID=A0A380CJG8_SPOPA|nr:M15 family metallopeptidase [Sporosarcina pasteurii]MDS9472162.1 M15 family metallopeptidase [Sporosarcina pasteurii]QBQ06874.1 D-alanyl-D-alanine carboxypeptidase family protein [Sporosarcina pasteurii]SUJ20302.1 D-alanyl-D-alanine carboxypeptidase [Sporosarcina pasteurii]
MRKRKQYMFRTEKQKSKKKTVLTITLITASVLIAVVVGWIGFNDWDIEKSTQRAGAALGLTKQTAPNKKDTEEQPDAGENSGVTEKEPELEEPQEPEGEPVEEVPADEAIQYIEGQELPEEPTYIDGVLIANKKYPLPSTYAPGESKEAREAFEEMAAAALLVDYRLVAFSTYRSFEYQTELYKRYVDRDGVEEADRYSARPGYSEHQTGLAFDIGEVNKEQDWASSRFGETDAGKWLAENAHLYGFIMRYPEGKEFITGYMYESWHFRYVGVEIAKDIYENEITLEEYLGI